MLQGFIPWDERIATHMWPHVRTLAGQTVMVLAETAKIVTVHGRQKIRVSVLPLYRPLSEPTTIIADFIRPDNEEAFDQALRRQTEARAIMH